jgi:farnesyl-diphosphate farnesyltransferase
VVNPWSNRFRKLDFDRAFDNSLSVSRPPEKMNALPEELLKSVSRSFYLTLRALPSSVRFQIGLAYLLARTTDTIADTEILSVDQRLEALQRLRARIQGESRAPLAFGELAQQQGLPGERVLLERTEDSLALLARLSSLDLHLVRAVLETITSGQELDLQRFAGASNTKIVALQTDAELDDYTYRVAGCVGEFWTRICRAHVFPRAKLNEARLLADGIRFGKGLQLVNILRDMPNDLRKGRCYLPAPALAAAGLQPSDLLEPAGEKKFRTVYDRYLATAADHLAAGWSYTNALPWRCARIRLACAWPVLIGVRTLARLRTENPLDPVKPVKVTRPEVTGILWRSVLLYPVPPLWRMQARLAVSSES